MCTARHLRRFQGSDFVPLELKQHPRAESKKETGVTPDTMNVTASLLVQVMKKHHVALTKRVESCAAQLKEALPSRT